MDLATVNTDLVSREFLAVVIAGFGNESVSFFSFSSALDLRLKDFSLSQAIMGTNHVPKLSYQWPIDQ